MKRLIILCLLIVAGCSHNLVLDPPHIPVYDLAPLEAKTEPENSLADLTLEEKIGQLLVAGFPNAVMTDELHSLIEDTHVGGFILFRHNLPTAHQSVDLINGLKKANENNDYPLIISVDQEGGRVTRLPELAALPSNLAVAQKEGMAFDYGRLLGELVGAFGFNMNFAPVLDVNNEPNNPVIGDRAFGSTVEVVTENGLQLMDGIKETKVIPVVKHFPGHGDVTVDSHFDLPVIDKSLSELEVLELAPFQAAIEAGAPLVMISHLLLPQLDDQYPASMSKAIITDLLRDKMQFDGLVITDDMTMGAITNTYSMEEASSIMIDAGVDLLLLAGGPSMVKRVAAHLLEEVEAGRLSEERIDESVLRIIALKQSQALTDDLVDSIHVDLLNEEIEDFRQQLSKD